MIFVENRSGRDFSTNLLERAAQAVLDFSQRTEVDLTLALVDEPTMLSLNKDFLGNDAGTDVLSFPALEQDPESGHLYLGDVVLSPVQAAKQSAERGHSLDDEIRLLVVHGILHLLGYDHGSPDDKARMWDAQSSILRQINISPGIVHE